MRRTPGETADPRLTKAKLGEMDLDTRPQVVTDVDFEGLATEDYVNQAVSTNSAEFQGTYGYASTDPAPNLGFQPPASASDVAPNPTIAEALKTAAASSDPTNNDYAFVKINYTPTTEADEFRRFKYDEVNEIWKYEYTLDSRSFTEAQWAAINSGITAGMIPEGASSNNKLATAADATLTERTGFSAWVAVPPTQVYTGGGDEITVPTPLPIWYDDDPLGLDRGEGWYYSQPGTYDYIGNDPNAIRFEYLSIGEPIVATRTALQGYDLGAPDGLNAGKPVASEAEVEALRNTTVKQVRLSTAPQGTAPISPVDGLVTLPVSNSATSSSGTTLASSKAVRTVNDAKLDKTAVVAPSPTATKGQAADAKATGDALGPLLFAQYYPEGNVKSAAEFTPGIKYDDPDTTNRTITVKPFCGTDGTAANDNSSLVGRVVIPPFVDAQGNGYVSDDGTRYKVVGISGFSGSFRINTNLTAIIAPSTMTIIGGEAFRNCTTLSSVSLPSATDIGIGPFANCDALTFVSLPGATTIDTRAFTNNDGLTTVSLPAATSIGSSAFGGCSVLASVDFGDTPRSSVPTLGTNAFRNTPGTCKIIVPDAQYDAWIAASGWSDLVTAGYRFLKHSEWEYARRHELADALNERPTKAAMDEGWWSEWEFSGLPDGGTVNSMEWSEAANRWLISISVGSDTAQANSHGNDGEYSSIVQFAGIEVGPYSLSVTATRHRVAAPVPTKPEDIDAASEAEAEELRNSKLQATSAFPRWNDLELPLGKVRSYKGRLYKCISDQGRPIDPPDTSPLWETVTIEDVTESLEKGKLNSAAIAPDYDPTATYEMGDPVTYQGDIYTARVAISTPEAWNPEKWQLRLIPNYMEAEIRRAFAAISYGPYTNEEPARERLDNLVLSIRSALGLGTFYLYCMDVVSTVVLSKVGNPGAVSLEYSIDDGNSWAPFTVGSTPAITLQPGQFVHFRAASGSAHKSFAKDASNYHCFVLSGKLAAGGNVMALLYHGQYEATNATAFPSDSTHTFESLFKGCTALYDASSLAIPPLTMVGYALRYMFDGCTNLRVAPSVPATTLAISCYHCMFRGCSSLKESPVLPASTLVTNCYYYMFDGCSQLDTVTADFTAFSIANATEKWLRGVSGTGTFYCIRDLVIPSGSSRGENNVPSGWTVRNTRGPDVDDALSLTSEKPVQNRVITTELNKKLDVDPIATGLLGVPVGNYADMEAIADRLDTVIRALKSASGPDDRTLYFQSLQDNSTVAMLGEGDFPDVSLEYSVDDGENWAPFVVGTRDSPRTVINLSKGRWVRMRATETASHVSFSTQEGPYVHFSLGGSLSVGGNSMSLFYHDYATIATRTSFPAGGTRQFSYLFYGCSALKDASSMILPATVLAEYCYRNMFDGCTSLVAAPALPATALAAYCYICMFQNCTSLVAAPALPASSLAEYCYGAMFSQCTALRAAPELPATTLAENCYNYMFSACTALVDAPELPATAMAEGCYKGMFIVCRSLVVAPRLPATTLAAECYKNMFEECDSLRVAPDLPAATLVDGCYYGMFGLCPNIDSIVADFTDFNPEQVTDQTQAWLYGVSGTGTFHCKPALSIPERNQHTVPPGWTVARDR